MAEPLDLDAIKARAEAATPGPWRRTSVDPIAVVAPDASLIVADVPDEYGGTGSADTDAEFIAHARTDVPALVAEVERLRSQVDDLSQGDAVVLENARLRAIIDRGRDFCARPPGVCLPSTSPEALK